VKKLCFLEISTIKKGQYLRIDENFRQLSPLFAAFPWSLTKKEKKEGKIWIKNIRTNSSQPLDFPKKFDIMK